MGAFLLGIDFDILAKFGKSGMHTFTQKSQPEVPSQRNKIV